MADKFGFEIYADMMVADYLLGNKDRHWGNFGWLVDNATGKLLRAAPLFDQGQSFFAVKDFAEEDLQDIEGWIEAEADFSRYMDTWDLLETFVRPGHSAWIEKLAGFKFENHSRIPVPDAALSALNTFLKCQLQKVEDVVEKKVSISPAF